MYVDIRPHILKSYIYAAPTNLFPRMGGDILCRIPTTAYFLVRMLGVNVWEFDNILGNGF